jgi:serine/threonine protein kinase
MTLSACPSPSPADQLGKIIKKGWADKRGSLFTGWKRRYFVLQGSVLSYWTNPNGRLRGEIDLRKASSIMETEKFKKEAEITISYPKRRYYIRFPLNADRGDWMSALKAAQSNQTEMPGPGDSICIADFEIIREIKSGIVLTLQLVRCRRDGKLYLMKTTSKALLAASEEIEEIEIEQEVLNQTVHPFLVGARFTFQTPTQFIQIVDYLPGGDLFDRLQSEGRFPEWRTRVYAAEVLLGLAHLHSMGLAHRDLKPENILIDHDGHLKLIGFKFVKTGMLTRFETTKTFCGTAEYLAPEVVRREPYTKAVDWWSFGVLIYELLIGSSPFYGENQARIFTAIQSDPVEFTPGISATARDLILKLLDRNPKTRLGTMGHVDVMRHPFFASVNWEDVQNKRIVTGWTPTIGASLDISHSDDEVAKKEAPGPHKTRVVEAGVESAFEGFTMTAPTRL